MTPHDDDKGVTSLDLDDRTADALLSGHAVEGEPLLTDALGQMRAWVDVPAPPPSSALMALMDGGLAAASSALPARSRSGVRTPGGRRRSWALQLSLGVTGCLGLIAGAAAANELPAPAQTAVANVVEAVTPLHVPRPHHPSRPTTPPADSGAKVQPHSPATPAPGGDERPRNERPRQVPATGRDDHNGTGSGDDARPSPQASNDGRETRDGSATPTTDTSGGDAPSSDSGAPSSEGSGPISPDSGSGSADTPGG